MVCSSSPCYQQGDARVSAALTGMLCSGWWARRTTPGKRKPDVARRQEEMSRGGTVSTRGNQAEDDAAAEQAAPSPHVVKDTWYDRVWPAGTRHRKQDNDDEEILSPVASPVQLDFVKAQRESFLKFLNSDLPEAFEAWKNSLRLSDKSVVPISAEEASLLGLTWTRWPNMNNEKIEDIVGVELGSIPGAKEKGRFQVELMPDELVYLSESASQDASSRGDETPTVSAVIPGAVTDGATGFSFRIEVPLGDIPVLSEAGTFSVSGVKWVLLYRLLKTPGVYCLNEQLILRTQDGVVGLSYKEKKEEVFIHLFNALGQKCQLPLPLFATAAGITPEEFEKITMGEVKGKWLKQEEACKQIAKEFKWDRPNEQAARRFKVFLERLTRRRLGRKGRERYNAYLDLHLPMETRTLTLLDLMTAAGLLYRHAPLQEDDQEPRVNTFVK